MSEKQQMSFQEIQRKYKSRSLFSSVLLKRLGTGIRSLTKAYPLSHPDNTDLKPVFIISSGRSGTTLLRSMLVASGQISIPPETQNIHTLANKFLAYHGLKWDDLSRLVLADFESHHNFFMWEINLAPLYPTVIDLPKESRSLADILDQVYMFYAAKKFPEAKLWGDQSPIYTFHLTHILKIFPHAMFIHMLRDGRDVVSSEVIRHGERIMTEGVYRWKKSIEITTKLQKKLPVNRFLEIRYEHLVQESEQTLRDVCSFIGITFNPIMLEYWRLPSTVEHKYQSFHQNIGKPVFSTSVGKWRERLSQEQINYIMSNLEEPLRLKAYID